VLPVEPVDRGGSLVAAAVEDRDVLAFAEAQYRAEIVRVGVRERDPRPA
jgi:hypothetical protein